MQIPLHLGLEKMDEVCLDFTLESLKVTLRFTSW